MSARPEQIANDFNARDFRDALSTFATGVTIVTAQDAEANPIGMTASSFNSVSMDPPLVLWSVTKTALSASAFKAAKHFAIHVLATDQTELANLFARSGEDKFGAATFHLDENNVPVIAGSATRFDCALWATYEGGDHWIIVGKVTSIDRAKKEGLVFGGGAYAIAAPITALSKSVADSTLGGGEVENMLFYHLSRAYHQMGHQFHEVVRANGLTLAEWRILANLHGGASISYDDLAARTFLDPQSLKDVLSSLFEEGLCILATDNGVPVAAGTASGTERVQHLFDRGREMEESVLEHSTRSERDELVRQLKVIVSSTEKTSPEN